MIEGAPYRALGEGWELAYWPPAPPELGVAPEVLGSRAAAPDTALLDELRQKVDFGRDRGLDPATTFVRSRRLPFYGSAPEHYQLLEIFLARDGVVERARAVRITRAGESAASRWVPLAWTSVALHDLNDGAGGALLAAADAATVRDYADFFTGSIEGDEGTFHVIRFGAVEWRPAPPDDAGRFAVSADVLYAGQAFHCVFLVARDGRMEMTDDEPFADPALPAEHRWLTATRRIQCTERLHVAIAAEVFLKCMRGDRAESELLEELQRAVDSPDTMAKWLRQANRPLEINGNIDAPAGSRFRRDWALGGVLAGRAVVLKGSLLLSRCRFDQGLSLPGWTIAQSLRLDHAEVRGDLLLERTRIEADSFGDRGGSAALHLRGLEVTGDLRFDGGRVAGDVSLRYARIRGQLEFFGGEFAGAFDAQGISVTSIFCQADYRTGEPTRIDGTLNLSGASIPGHVQLEPVRVGGDLQVITPVALGAFYVREGDAAAAGKEPGPRRSAVGGEVCLGNVQVAGRLEIALDGCGRGYDVRNVSCAAFSLRGSVGPLCVVAGLHSRGDARFLDLAFDGAADGEARLDLRHARVDGDLEVAGPAVQPAAVPRELALGGALVEGQLRLRSLAVRGSVDLSDVTVKRDVSLEGVTAGAALCMRHMTCHGDARLEGVVVGAGIGLQHAVINGTLALCAEEEAAARQARIGGKLLLNALTAGKVVMTGDSWESPGPVGADVAPGNATRFIAWPVGFGLLTVGLPLAALALLGAVLGGRSLSAAVFGAVEFENDWRPLWVGIKWLFWTLLVAVLLLWVGRMMRVLRALRSAPDPRTLLAVDRLPEAGGRGLGPELGRLWGAALARSVLLVALAATVFVTRVLPDLQFGPGADTPALPWVACVLVVAWMTLVHLRACAAAGYGLSRLPAGEAAAAGVGGTLFALDVAAYFFTILYLALDGWLPSFLHLAVTLGATCGLALLLRLLAPAPWPSGLRMGFLDAASDGDGGSNVNQHRLNAAQVTLGFRDWLQVVTLNRLRPAVAGHHDPKCSLERAHIGYLKIVHPVPDYVDIGNLAVDRWELPENPGDTRSYQYLNLLSHAADFATDSFTALERSLRNAGDREAAEVLHRAMRRETQWRERRWAQTAAMLVLSLSGYGTKRARLIGVMSLWLVFTALWFAADYERSVAIAMPQEAEFMQVADDECMPDGRVSHPAEGAPDRASPASCQVSARAELFGAVLARPDAPLERLGHGLALAIRYHVPILAWDIRPFIMPRGAGMWVYVTIVEMIHWILWPILIASLVPAVLPRRDD